jgi:hypothetical protein
VREIRTEIEIDAPAERVWEVLTEFDAYPEWNPFITRLEGAGREGARLSVTIRPPGRKAMTLGPTVKVLRPVSEFRWLGRLGIPGIFDGEHVHEVEALGADRSRYTQREHFSGVLVPFTGKVLDATEAGFREMNTALKARAEAPNLRAG